MSSTKEKTEADIIREEASQIVSRRAKAFPLSEVAAFQAQFETAGASASDKREHSRYAEEKQRCDGPPVGLAISGGGIRSASTSLGLIQSLYRTGLLRFVDYLSTVSGGTYSGALLAAEIHSQSKPIDFTPEDPPSSLDSSRLPLLHNHRTRQPDIVLGLANAAESLKKPLVFLSRHLFGLLLVNAFLISGLVALTAALAWLFRSLDHPTAMLYLAELGFQTDFARAMFPAAVAFLVWAIAALVSALLGRRMTRFPPLSAGAYGVLLITLALGVVLLFSTANLDLKQLEDWLDKDSDFGNRIRSALGTLGRVLTVVMAVAIAPLFRIHDIVRSGTSGTRVERWMFNLVSTTAIFGIPLILFYFFSAENISRLVGSDKGFQITRGSLRDKERVFETLLDDVRNNGPKNNAIDGFLAEFANAVDKAVPLVRKDNSSAASADTSAATKTAQPTDEPGTKRSEDFASEAAVAESAKDKSSTTSPQNDGESEKKRATVDGQTERKAIKLQVIKIHRLEQRVKGRNARCQWFPFTIWTCLTSEGPANSNRANSGDEEFNSWVDLRAKYRDELDILAAAINTSLDSLDDGTPEKGTLDLKPIWNPVFGLAKSTADPSQSWIRGFLAESAAPPQSTPEIERIKRFTSLRNRHVSLMNDLEGIDSGANESKKKLISDIKRVRWEMMQVAFGDDLLYSPKEVFAAVVNEPDQATRGQILFWSLVLFVFLGFVPVNATTNHGFYRDRIAARWIAPHSKEGDSLALSKLRTTEQGGPLLIINNTVNLGGKRAVETDSRLERMILTPAYTGCDRLGFRETKDLLGESYTLADATALSGSAVSPLATENVLARALLIITNFRLGQWLPNPSSRLVQHGLAYPKPFFLLWEHFLRAPEHRSYLFVSDGGHHENTGIESLLVRRCRVIIAADFSEDGNYELADFRKFSLRVSEQLGVQLLEQPSPFSVRDLILLKDQNRVRSHLAVFRILYPRPETGPDDGGEGWLILIKPGLNGNEPAGLLECDRNFAKFPHDPTGDQLFEETRFMAYRQLGEHLGEELFRFLSTEKDGGGAGGPSGAAGLVDAPPEYQTDPTWLSKHWRPFWVSAGKTASAAGSKSAKPSKKSQVGKSSSVTSQPSTSQTATTTPVESPSPTETSSSQPGEQ
jgi:hypothetical protein